MQPELASLSECLLGLVSQGLVGRMDRGRKSDVAKGAFVGKRSGRGAVSLTIQSVECFRCF